MRAADIVPESIEAVDRDQIVEETTESFGEFLDVFRWVLLAFALIALFVSIFVIANTFAIVLGQRIRELGLLRAIGAGSGQVTGSVLLEALVVGIDRVDPGAAPRPGGRLAARSADRRIG